jgi:hypothetical protein
MGLVHGAIQHTVHGRKGDRGYLSYWKMFLEHGFDPHADLKPNKWDGFEFSGNKPAPEQTFDR